MKKLISAALVVCVLVALVAVWCAELNKAPEQGASAATSNGLAENVQDGQILQCWNWSFTNIKNNMKSDRSHVVL